MGNRGTRSYHGWFHLGFCSIVYSSHTHEWQGNYSNPTWWITHKDITPTFSLPNSFSRRWGSFCCCGSLITFFYKPSRYSWLSYPPFFLFKRGQFDVWMDGFFCFGTINQPLGFLYRGWEWAWEFGSPCMHIWFLLWWLCGIVPYQCCLPMWVSNW